MSTEEREAFEQIPHFQDALTLRRWDDLAKVKGLETAKLETYRNIVQQCLIQELRKFGKFASVLKDWHYDTICDVYSMVLVNFTGKQIFAYFES